MSRLHPPALRHFVAGVAAALCTLAAQAAQADAAAPGGWRLEKVVTLPSSNSGWDYQSLDERRGRLFIAHRKDGLQVYDVVKGRLLKTLPQSTGANTSALAPEFDLGIAGTTDGQVVLFRPSTLQTLSRRAAPTGGFDGATYDPASRRFAMVGEYDEAAQSTPLLVFDGRTGHLLGSVPITSKKVDAPRPDGQGRVLLPLRDRALAVRVDLRELRLDKEYALGDCTSPAALETEPASGRVFIGCRGQGGSKPQLVVLDMESGSQLAMLPIGRGVDEVMYDPRQRTVVTANGQDGTMTVADCAVGAACQLRETVSTWPMARTGVLDPVRGRIHLVTARYVVRPAAAGSDEPETYFVPDSFSVLTYAQRPR